MKPSARISAVVIAAALLAVSLWLLFGYRLPGDSRFWLSVQDTGHALLFFALALGLCLCCHMMPWRRKNPWWICGGVALACLIFGGAVELVQSQVGREASWSDLLLDLEGIVAGACFYLALFARLIPRLVGAVFAAALLIHSALPTLSWSLAEYQQARQFPTIAGFENPWLTRFAEGYYGASLEVIPAPSAWSQNPSRVVRVRFGQGRWPGLTFSEVYHDWRGYNRFVFEAFNPDSEIHTLTLRIHDRHHNLRHDDRYNLTFSLPPGHSSIVVNIEDIASTRSGRRLDLGQMSQIMLYMSNPSQPVTLYFDRFRLE